MSTKFVAIGQKIDPEQPTQNKELLCGGVDCRPIKPNLLRLAPVCPSVLHTHIAHTQHPIPLRKGDTGWVTGSQQTAIFVPGDGGYGAGQREERGNIQVKSQTESAESVYSPTQYHNNEQ